jgi:hypothetical protein
MGIASAPPILRALDAGFETALIAATSKDQSNFVVYLSHGDYAEITVEPSTNAG